MFRQFYDNIAEPQQEKSWLFIIGSYILDIFLILFLIFMVIPFEWLIPISTATLGIINGTLIINIGLFLIIIVVYLSVLGKEKISNLGLKLRKLPVGILSLYGLYLLLNIFLLILNVIFQNPTIWWPYWVDSGNGLTYDVGNLLAQIFGNALFEETLFRGFIWIQISKKMKNFLEKKQVQKNIKTWSLIVGALISNILFSLLHIPVRLLTDITGWELVGSLALLFAIGMLFTSVYFITENLFVTIGIHVLNNISFALFYPIYPTFLLVIYITIAGLCIWGALKHQSLKNRKRQE